MTSSEIIDLLIAERHPSPSWVTVREMRLGCGFGPHERSMDLWALEASVAKACPAIAYEVKVAKHDFMRDIKDAEKQRGARTFSDLFYYIAPLGVIPQDKLPEWAGLMEVHPPDERPEDANKWWTPRKRCRVTVKAYPRSKCAPSWPFVVSLLRRSPSFELTP